MLRFMPFQKPGRWFILFQLSRVVVLFLIWVEPAWWLVVTGVVAWGLNMGVTTTLARAIVQEAAEPLSPRPRHGRLRRRPARRAADRRRHPRLDRRGVRRPWRDWSPAWRCRCCCSPTAWSPRGCGGIARPDAVSSASGRTASRHGHPNADQERNRPSPSSQYRSYVLRSMFDPQRISPTRAPESSSARPGREAVVAAQAGSTASFSSLKMSPMA